MRFYIPVFIKVVAAWTPRSRTMELFLSLLYRGPFCLSFNRSLPSVRFLFLEGEWNGKQELNPPGSSENYHETLRVK